MDQLTGETSGEVRTDGEPIIVYGRQITRGTVVGLHAFRPDSWRGQPLGPDDKLMIVEVFRQSELEPLRFVCRHDSAPKMGDPVEIALHWTPAP